MAYEVEMKAWVDDWAAVEARLRATCTFSRAFRKEDRYFAPADDARLFRVRVDGEAAYVTYKEKRIADGAEVNLEREFGVDDAGAFVDFVTRFRAREEFAKVKEGLHFDHDGLTVELVRVEGLGEFLEVELVHESDDPAVHRRAVERIRAFLADVGIRPERIEEQPYMKLLRERRR